MTGEYANNFTFFYAPKVVTQSCNPVIDFATNRDELGSFQHTDYVKKFNVIGRWRQGKLLEDSGSHIGRLAHYHYATPASRVAKLQHEPRHRQDSKTGEVRAGRILALPPSIKRLRIKDVGLQYLSRSPAAVPRCTPPRRTRDSRRSSRRAVGGSRHHFGSAGASPSTASSQ